jgi:hypothetical protein
MVNSQAMRQLKLLKTSGWQKKINEKCKVRRSFVIHNS